MSSRFVAAGGGEVESPAENDDWARARKQVEEKKKPQTEALGTQEGGKSLYEHLQAQKAAKQDAFEEASKLRNQFRPLDDGEIDFLESIQRSERADAADLRKATAEQLDAFRQEQAALERTSKAADLHEGESEQQNTIDNWTSSRKRRRPQTDEVGDTAKVKKVLATADSLKEGIGTSENKEEKVERPTEAGSPIDARPITHEVHTLAAPMKISANVTPASMLVAYDSDSDT